MRLPEDHNIYNSRMLNPQELFTSIHEFNLVSSFSDGVRCRKTVKATIIFVMSVCLSVHPPVRLSVGLYGTTGLPLDGFP